MSTTTVAGRTSAVLSACRLHVQPGDVRRQRTFVALIPRRRSRCQIGVPGTVDLVTVQLNHTIVRVRDKQESATFLAEILGLPEPTPCGPFLVVQVDNDVSLDYADDHGPANPQHYAFLVGETEFDEIFDRIRSRYLPYWADPGKRRVSST